MIGENLVRRMPVGMRLYSLISVLVLFAAFVGLALFSNTMSIKKTVTNDIGKAMLAGQKDKMLVATDALAVVLGVMLEDVSGEQARQEMIRKEVDRFRFEDDKSGYFFVYKGTVNVAMPPSKDLQGKDMSQAKDKNGVYIIRELARIAKGGGGFLEYVWPKPGAGDVPKVGYAAMIPGSAYWIGTGVYTDTIQMAQDAMDTLISDQVGRALSTTFTILGVVLVLVILPLSLLIKRSINNPIVQSTLQAGKIANGDFNVDLALGFDDEPGKLQSALSVMAGNLKSNMDEIAQQSEIAREKAQAAVKAGERAESLRQKAEEQSIQANKAREDALKAQKVAEDESIRAQEAMEAARQAKERADVVAAYQETEAARLSDVLSQVATGDLTSVYSPLEGGPETERAREVFGDIGRAQAEAMSNLAKVVSRIKDSSQVLATSSEQLTSVSQELLSSSEDLSNQSMSVAGASEEMSSTVSAMASVAEETSMNVATVSSTTEQMSANMNTVAGAVDDMSSAIGEIAEHARNSAGVSDRATDMARDTGKTMAELGDAAKDIGKVTAVIKRIAEQTNLLALNATIEAASAGEAGKGFAVVAGEIKELANQSAKAAEDIAEKISGIQRTVLNAVEAMEDISGIVSEINESINRISTAVEQQNASSEEITMRVEETSKGALDISHSISEIAKGADDMAQSSSEASRVTTDLSRNIQHMDQASSNASTSARHVNEASGNLSEMAEMMKKLTQGFIV